MHWARRTTYVALSVVLVACATQPQLDSDALRQEALRGIEKPVPVVPQSDVLSASASAVSDDARGAAIERGTESFIHPQALDAPKPRPAGSGAINFQFEDQPIQAVVQVILGDVLKNTYTIAPGVQGNVTFSTSEPVDRSQALPILDTLLRWTGNALVQKEGRYVVMPARDAYAGQLVPSTGPLPQGGLQARWFPLHYIAAPEMEKLLGPYARPEAILQVDASRNLLVLAGTREELANYQRAIEAFDVNWLRGMSVAVFHLQRSGAADLVVQLERLFGEKSATPVAGMVRFIPVEQSNVLIAMSSQPAYLDEVRQWVERIDHGGNEPQLYVYEAHNVDVEALADDLNAIYGGGASSRHVSGGEVGPKLTAQTIMGGEPGAGSKGSAMSSGGGVQRGGGSTDNGAASGVSTLENGARITASQEGNQLLVRATPAQWDEIRSVIRKLDAIPTQVQVEMRILEVTLTGEFRFGVQWYLQGLANGGDADNPRQGALGRGGVTFNPSDTLFYSFVNHNLQVALRAMESEGKTRVLSAPSVVVANKQAAHIQVGSRIPITQNFIDTASNGNTTVGTVQYQDTGVILDVIPRVNPGGLVYLDVGQQVSDVDTSGQTDAAGNPTIRQRQVNTHAIVQSGQTVLLGGLIQQDESSGHAGVPVLNRVPGLGRLFGTTRRSRTRTELIVLITPTVISKAEDARQITNEYVQKLKAIAPSGLPLGDRQSH